MEVHNSETSRALNILATFCGNDKFNVRIYIEIAINIINVQRGPGFIYSTVVENFTR